MRKSMRANHYQCFRQVTQLLEGHDGFWCLRRSEGLAECFGDYEHKGRNLTGRELRKGDLDEIRKTVVECHQTILATDPQRIHVRGMDWLRVLQDCVQLFSEAIAKCRRHGMIVKHYAAGSPADSQEA